MESKDVAIIEPAHVVAIKGNTLRPQPIIPHNIEEALEFARLICDGRICPDSYNDKNGTPDPKKVVIGILKGAEVGLPPITALSNIAIINGRPCIYGEGGLALVQDKNLIEKMEIEWIGGERDSGPTEMAAGGQDHTPSIRDFTDDFGCVARIWRRGQSEPYMGKFTVRDAKRAHLWGNTKKVPWIEHPKAMLQWRAMSRPLRIGFSDALAGLAIREEVEDLPPEAPAKADTRFLDDTAPVTDVSVDASQSQETEATEAKTEGDTAEPGFAPPAFLPIPEKDGQNNYEAWAVQAAEIIRTAPTPKWLSEWKDLNVTTIDGLKTLGKNGPAWRKRMLDLIESRRSELLAGA